jgi:methionine-rich copper-binding protein CopC
MKLIRLFTVLTIATFGSLFVATSANAHADLVSSSPADGSTLEVPPAKISLTFSEPVLAAGAAVVVTEASGQQVGVGKIEVSGATISVASPADLAAGEYTVTWRATAEDGHAMTGKFEFTYNGDAVVSNATPMMTALETTTAQDVEAESGSDNTWVILLASFVASATIGTLYAAKKRK